MPWYRCFVAGENFPGELVNYRDGPVGFYTTRWVEADSPGHAQVLVLRAMRQDEDFQIDESMPDAERARISFELIEEIPKPITYIEEVSWFPMDDESLIEAAQNDVPFG